MKRTANVVCFASDLDAPFPMLYISFPSAKDPEWDARYPDKSAMLGRDAMKLMRLIKE